MAKAARSPLGAALGLVLAVATIAGGSLAPYLVAILAVSVVFLLSYGWSELLEIPTPLGTKVIMIASGIAGVLVSLFTPLNKTPMALICVLALAVIASFAGQMVRKERSHLTESLTATVVGSVLAVLTSGWVVASTLAPPAGIILAAVSALVMASFIAAMPLPSPWQVLVGLFCACLVSTLIALALMGGITGAITGFGLGLLVSALSLALLNLLTGVFRADEPRSLLTIACVPVIACGFLLYTIVLAMP